LREPVPDPICADVTIPHPQPNSLWADAKKRSRGEQRHPAKPKPQPTWLPEISEMNWSYNCLAFTLCELPTKFLKGPSLHEFSVAKVGGSLMNCCFKGFPVGAYAKQ